MKIAVIATMLVLGFSGLAQAQDCGGCGGIPPKAKTNHNRVIVLPLASKPH